MKTLGDSKADLLEISKQQIKTALPRLDWTLRQKLAATCRILFRRGHDSGLAGQITARAEDDARFYTQQLGYGFDEITASSLLLVDEDLQVLQGEGMANPANRFHSWIYRARPDVQCIIHTHPLHVCALSLLERPLKVAHMDSCMLYEDVGFLARWAGVPVGNEEGRLISETLGDKRAAILAHHGLVVAAASVEEACVLAVQIERSARLQLLAEAVGEIREIDPALAREAHDWILQPARSRASFAYFARQLLRTLAPQEQQALLD
ncbi:aldolase [Herbaspirillum seropedicae]|uniref:aldolase n=1 Tax=Herbaspirillum seropedicae TaxID=964 RepID=UPI003F8D641F